MPRNKSRGPDGYTVEFYTASWEIIGQLNTLVVLEFFLSSKLLKQLNSTSIALIPKVQHPTMVTEFKPISCCNILYRAIAKILANRLKISVPSLISWN